MVKYAIQEIYDMAFRTPGPTSFADSGSAGGTVSYGLDEVSVTAKRVKPVQVTINGKPTDTDMRVRIMVPGNYIRPSTSGNVKRNELKNGIIFPYTPQISLDYKSDYKNMNAVHSNYTQYFYTNSSVGAIQITAKFTVQNDKDAVVWLSTKHLLSALIKMPYADDPGAGAPPPVCRLMAYGDYMLKNVPIVIQSFRLELPADVDYYSVGTERKEVDTETDESGRFQTETTTIFNEPNFVPTVSTFVISCLPVYSRKEMLQFSLKNFLEDYTNNTKYL